jgi:hypothetical protein
MKSPPWAMEKLIEYFRRTGENFGNPTIQVLQDNLAFDLSWEAKPPLTLRWTWADPQSLRRDPSENDFLLAALAGAHDHDAHVELADPSHVSLFVSTRYQDFHGKVKANKIVRCLTKEGEWMNQALKAGIQYLADLG